MVCKRRDLDRGSDQREVGPSHLGQPWYVREEIWIGDQTRGKWDLLI